MGIYGADVAALRSLATSFARSASDLSTTRAVLRDAIEGSRWQGADAAEMRGAWSSMADRALAQACQVLDDYASALRRNADEQDVASGSDGAIPRGTGGPPDPTGAPLPDPGARTVPAAHLVPEEGGALDKVGDTTSTLGGEHGKVKHDENGLSGRVNLPGGGHVGGDADGVEVGASRRVETTVEGSAGKLSITSGVEVVGSARSAGGYDEYTLAADASTKVAGEVAVWRLSASGEAASGDRFTFGVRVPDDAGTDPRTVDPFSPGTYPPGTRITFAGEAYRSDSTTFGYELLRSGHASEEATGVTTTVEWLEGDVVRLNTGDTESMKLYEGVGLGKDDWSAMLGRTNELRSAEMGEVTLDLSSESGRAAYDRFLATGELPTAPGEGVSGTTTYGTYDFSSGSKVDLKTPLVEYTRENVTSSGSGVTVLNPDGTSDHHGQVATQGGVERNYSHHIDADGQVVPSRSTDSFTFRATGTTDAYLSNPNLSLGAGASADPGSTVRISFTPAQIADLQELAARHADPTTGGPITDLVYSSTDPFAPGGPTVRTPSEFADALYGSGGSAGAGAGGDVMLERIVTIMARAGEDEFPGTVEVVPR